MPPERRWYLAGPLLCDPSACASILPGLDGPLSYHADVDSLIRGFVDPCILGFAFLRLCIIRCCGFDNCLLHLPSNIRTGRIFAFSPTLIRWIAFLWRLLQGSESCATGSTATSTGLYNNVGLQVAQRRFTGCPIGRHIALTLDHVSLTSASRLWDHVRSASYTTGITEWACELLHQCSRLASPVAYTRGVVHDGESHPATHSDKPPKAIGRGSLPCEMLLASVHPKW